MKILIQLILIFTPCSLIAQNCNCLLNFKSVVASVTENYSGFEDKTKNRRIEELKSFTKILQKKAAFAPNTDSCYVILRTWTEYFKDHHLRVQLDWEYRKKNPEIANRLEKLFVQKTTSSATNEKLDPRTGIRVLNGNTLFLRLPSFEWSEKRIIDSILISNDAKLKTAENLIIDIRGNNGGTDYVYNKLLPLLYTNPIIGKPDEYRSSRGNLEILEENKRNSELSLESKEFLNLIIGKMKAQPYGYINPSGKDNYEIRLDTIYEFPKRVSIIVDNNTASSAETFLLTAMQSKKVLVYGENTAGIIDYGSTQFFYMPCKDLNLVIPIARSTRLPDHPLDNIGITPDVKVSKKDIISVVSHMMQ
jgi:hypothetical protein